MINKPLFSHGMRSSVRFLLIFAAVITLYVCCILFIYDPQTVEMLDYFADIMPELMAAVGMQSGTTNLLGFMISYLYGFILLVFPMLFCILRANGLIAKYIDQGSIVYLLAAPVKRRQIVLTQMLVFLSSLFALLGYTTVLEFLFAQMRFPGELSLLALLRINLGLLVLHCFLGGIALFSCCAFSGAKWSMLVGAGIPVLMYLFQMIANTAEKLEWARYFSAFSLYDPTGLAESAPSAEIKLAVLLIGSLLLYPGAIAVFCQKDFCV